VPFRSLNEVGQLQDQEKTIIPRLAALAAARADVLADNRVYCQICFANAPEGCCAAFFFFF
jgi:hypothetical protein